MAFKLKIITPNGLYLKEDIDSLNIKAVDGYLTILPSHFPLITMLDIAPMHIKIDNTEKVYAIAGGVLNVRKRETIILTNAIESPEEIDRERAENAKNRAEQRLKNKNNKDIDILRAESALKRAITRLSILDK